MNSTVSIIANLKAFNLEDITVVGKVDIVDDKPGPHEKLRVVELPEMSLAELCAHSSEICHKRIQRDLKSGERVDDLTIYIFRNGEEIGYIDCDGQFNYIAATQLRACVGWAIATDYGQKEKIHGFSLDLATAGLEAIVRRGSSKDFFFKDWSQAVQTVMVYGKTTRFGDGYCGVLGLFWRVATRTVLGTEHKGYPYAY